MRFNDPEFRRTCCERGTRRTRAEAEDELVPLGQRAGERTIVRRGGVVRIGNI